ncbi:MAG: thermonuclease family protein [Polyangiales bacterium]
MLICWSNASVYADASSLVFLNGRPTRVHFNDGDTFRSLDGPYTGLGTRLAGFNTLESWGPVHRWGGWHPFELYAIAKKATLNARRGIWHCTTEGKHDTHGRLLAACPDLAIDQIKKGLAHAMQIDDTPSRAEYLNAQHDAMKHKRGMWQKGVPELVLTSLHSADETQTKEPYNRMISTRDGHSEKWIHNDVYGDCEEVCAMDERPSLPAIDREVKALRNDDVLGPLLADWGNAHVEEFCRTLRSKRDVAEICSDPLYTHLLSHLMKRYEAGALGGITKVQGSCMTFTHWLRRFRDNNKAHCIKGHGAFGPSAIGVDR